MLPSRVASGFVRLGVDRTFGIRNTANVAARLAGQEKGVQNVDTLGGLQYLTVVSESGMYAAVFVSRKPQAERFRLWLTGDAIPSIRKRGGYVVPGSEAAFVNDLHALRRILLGVTSRAIEPEGGTNRSPRRLGIEGNSGLSAVADCRGAHREF